MILNTVFLLTLGKLYQLPFSKTTVSVVDKTKFHQRVRLCRPTVRGMPVFASSQDWFVFPDIKIGSALPNQNTFIAL